VLTSLPQETAVLRICRAANLWLTNRADEAVDELLSVRTELLGAPDSYLLGWCAYQLAAAESVRGNYEVARRYAVESLVSARRCGNPFLQVHALLLIGSRERALGRWATAYENESEALHISEEAGLRRQNCHALLEIGITQWKRGLLAKAMEAVSQHQVKVGLIQGGPLKWYGALLDGMILMHAGDYSSARALVVPGDSWDTRESTSRPSLLTTEFLGDIHLEQEEAAPALALYDEVLPKAMALVPKGDIVAELRRRRAECYYLLGRFDEAHTEAATGLEHCRELGDRYEEAATYRVLGLAAAAIGNASEAKKHFDQGFAYYDDIETPYEWGKLWMSYGDWLCGPHAAEYADAKGAHEAYRAAEDQFERMGAVAKLAMARQRREKLEADQPWLLHELASAQSVSTPDLPKPRRRPRGDAELERRSQWAFETFELITRNRPILDQLDDVAKLARSNAPILVLGESGTGKELIAAGIHRLSRRMGRFTPLNVAVVAHELFESELFGHTAGSFTGATRDKPGLFEISHDGTVFLDEVAEMPMELQSRLLRFLETGESRRIGATQSTRVNTRLIAATNRDRASLERGDGFRTDLYYRLAHAVFVLPPLRHRGDDVELLLDHFLALYAGEERKHVRMERAARERLLSYSWPGNIREMRALVRRLILLASDGGEIRESQLQLADERKPTTLTQELEHAERGRIASALDQHRGSRTEAARALGMKRTTLLNKMRRYGLR
jgi:transcriptional regulator with AAA-type ATPase domain